MWARLRLDIGWGDLLWTLSRAGVRDARSRQARVEAAWSRRGDALVCLSARSALDLCLQALAWPAGSEVVISAVTISDVATILERHGLVPVPVDLRVDTALPTADEVERSITPRTRALVVARLFGARSDLAELAALARRRGLLFIQDDAQTFDGERPERPEADVVLLSFGLIKTATALGGGIAHVADPGLLSAMRTLRDEQPLQRRAGYVGRVFKAACMKLLASRALFGAVLSAICSRGANPDSALHGLVRAFPGDRLLDRIRRRPCAPLLALLERRLMRDERPRVAERAAFGAAVAARVRSFASLPAAGSARHSYWVFPVLARDPDALVTRLRTVGLDATRRSSLVCLAPPPGRAPPLAAADLCDRAVFVPIHPRIGAGGARAAVEALRLDRAESDGERAARPARHAKGAGSA